MSVDAVTTETPLTARVAEEIRALLARRKMSGRELARRLDASQSWVSLRLSGTQPIDLNDLQRIAAVLGVSVTDLLPKNTVWKPATALGERVVATVGQARIPRPRTRTGTHRPGRPVRQTRPVDQMTRPATAVAAGR